jgi:hypothetical protein
MTDIPSICAAVEADPLVQRHLRDIRVPGIGVKAGNQWGNRYSL